MKAASILVIGNVNVDLVLGKIDDWPDFGTEIVVDHSEMRAGGSAGNTALALGGMGIGHRLIAATGDDVFGAWLRDAFDEETCDWIVSPGATTVTVGIVHADADRAFFTTPGHLMRADTRMVMRRLTKAPHSHAWAIIAGGFLMPDLMQNTTGLIDALKGLGWQVAIDPGWPPDGWSQAVRSMMRQWLATADASLLNEDEVVQLADAQSVEAAAEEIVARAGADHLLVLKRGPDGARAHHRGAIREATAPEVEVIDTVGAGDTFNAAFLAALANGDDVATALARGVRTASRAISTSPRRYGD
ncbi:carbohydrate kinase family protein [Oceaniradius stylonematis]|uniref:Carbohydrate kinase family protein n=1 Tax=Oceaniradius stylonematis TaxID=2184161 RepID=A0A3A8AB36_9HYPH|nr:carbohydrate kinase family protein [Oceaniradius stylonematis]RKF07517.1 carbohydrate kinase family protein [Oceaniradius stylonematis]